MSQPPAGLGQQTLNAGSWKLVTVVTQASVQILVLAVLARYILPEEFGIVAIAKIVIAFATMFSQAGLGPALIQKQDITPRHLRVGFTSGILLSIFFWLVLWLSAPAFALFFREEEIVWVLRAIGASFVLLSFGLVAKALLERALNFRRLMWAELGSYFFGYALVGITMAMSGYGVWALVGATLAQSLLVSLLCFALRPHNVLPSMSRRELSELFGFGGGLTLSRVFHFLGNYGDNAVIGRMLGAEALGIYGRAFHLMNLPAQYLGNVIDSVMFPAMARIQHRKEQLTHVFTRALSLVNLLLLPLTAVTLVLAPEIVAVILGPNWDAAVFPLQALATVTALKGTVRMCDSLARAVGAVYRSAARKAVYAVSVLAGAYLGHFFGVGGVAVGVSASVAVVCALMLHLSLSLLDARWRIVLPPLLPGAVFTSATLATLLPVTLLARAGGAPALVTLLAAVGAAGVLSVGLALRYPRLIGPGGLWLMGRMLDSVPPRGRLIEHLRKNAA